MRWRPIALALWVMLEVAMAGSRGQALAAGDESSSAQFILLPGNESLVAGSETWLRFLLIGNNGLPISEEASLSVRSDFGQVLRFERTSEGILDVLFLLPTEPRRKEVSLELRTLVAGQLVVGTFGIPIRYVGSCSVALSLSSSSLRLGRDPSVTFRIEGARADGLPLQLRDVTVRTTAGQIEQLRSDDRGRLEGKFLPEGLTSPQAVIIAAFVGEGRDMRVAWRSLILVATPSIPVNTEPGSTVWLEVGNRRTASQVAGQDGMARIPVEVSPGIDRVVVSARDKVGNTTRSTLDLGIPPFPRALLHLDRDRYRVDEQFPLLLTLLHIDGRGNPAPLPSIQTQVSGGRLGGFVEVAPGTFSASYSPPNEPGWHEVRLGIPVEEQQDQRLSASVEVKAGTPTRLDLKVTPSLLRTDDPPAEVLLRVLDQAGNPTPGSRPEAEVGFGTLDRFRSVAPGEYVSAFRPRASLESEVADERGVVVVPIRAYVERMAGEGPGTVLSLGVSEEVMVPNGRPVTLRALVMNRWGDPVRGVTLDATLLSGDGTLSQGQVTDPRGLADFQLQPGSRPGPVLIEVRAGGALSKRILLLLASEKPSNALPRLNAEPDPISLSTLTATTSIGVKAGLVRDVQVLARPNQIYTSVGASSQVRIRLQDQHQNLIKDPTLKVTVQLGRLEQGTWSEEGIYTARYFPPTLTRAVATDEVSVTNEASEYSGSTEVQLFRQEGRYIGGVTMGYQTNLAAINSPTVGLAGMVQVPYREKRFHLGGAVSYYHFVATGDWQVRYDLFPLFLFGCYRQQSGRFSPYVGGGFLLTGAILFTDYPSPTASSPPSSSSNWYVARATDIFPGLGALVGVEFAAGKGGLDASLTASFTQVRGTLDDYIEMSDHLGGIGVRLGYVVHY